MNLAILCNNNSEKGYERDELYQRAKETFNKVYAFGIQGKYINSKYGDNSVGFVSIVASRNNTNPIIEIKSILNVRKQIKANKIDSALIYGVKNHSAMAIGAKLGGAKNIICVVNGRGNLFYIGGVKGKVLRILAFPALRIAYGLSTWVCFQNSDDKEFFVKKHLLRNGEKAFLTGGSGVNLEKFPEQLLPGENRFLYLSRITPSKGIKEYISAAEIVKQKYPEAVFDIVGPLDSAVESAEDSYLRQACENRIVNYHGATKDVPSWMKKCRFFVYPSYYPEGVPRCAIQAIATGRPIITCNTVGCKETVVDGRNGFLIPPRDYSALAEKMIWMLEHPIEVEQMARESRKLAVEKFDVHKINEEIMEKLK